ncbi:MAG: type II/IV secretion system ATPase subunit [Nanoarchaeota archaeon]|nr:type II/IV secretion system ATPase subunit [Nanoarchaeota archaeon]
MKKIKIKFAKKGNNIGLRRVFRKAVKGYKNIKKSEKKNAPEFSIFADLVKVLGKTGSESAKEKEGMKDSQIKGIKITGIEEKKENTKLWKSEEEKRLSMIYPLIPRRPAPNQKIYASANILWSKKESALVYFVLEPKLSDGEKFLLDKIKNSLIEKFDVDFTKLRKGEAKKYLAKGFEETVRLMAGALPLEKQENIMYYVERDFIGLGKIEPLMQDPNIEDISCDGVGIPIFIYHRNSGIGTLRTNIMFENSEELDSFANKLAQRSGKTISVASPLVDASLPDGSRIQLTLGTDIARRGSNFTIRRFTEEPLSPIHMLKFGTVDSKILAFLWIMTEFGKSTLIGGSTATGKTTLLNALSLFIKPELKIVTIEDTAELRLPHSHWVPQVARQAIAEMGGRKMGEVDMFDLLRESLRQRPDFILVGEVRGKEAYVLFQQIATGHPGIATIHADTIEKLVDRLTTPPIELSPSLLENLDVIIFLVRVKYGNKYVRRISSVLEVTGFDREKNAPVTNEVFKWDPVKDKFATVNPSIVLKKISDSTGINEIAIQKDFGKRIRILNWLAEKNFTDYRIFANAMKMYYTQQNRLEEIMER